MKNILSEEDKEKLYEKWKKWKKRKNRYENNLEELMTLVQVKHQKRIITRRLALALQTKFVSKVEQIANKYSKYLSLKDTVLEGVRAKVLMSQYRDTLKKELRHLKEETERGFGDEEFRKNIDKLKSILKLG